MGLAMGVKLPAPDRQVINFMGDAAFGIVGMDIETAVRERIPITIIVLNNSTMAIYPDSRLPVAMERYHRSCRATSLRWPRSWVPTARELPTPRILFQPSGGPRR